MFGTTKNIRKIIIYFLVFGKYFSTIITTYPNISVGDREGISAYTIFFLSCETVFERQVLISSKAYQKQK